MKKDNIKLQNASNTQQSNNNKNGSDSLYILQPIKTVNGDTLIKRYQKIKKVGQGSYSKCFLVQTVNSQSTYVVKIIPKKKLQVLIKQKLVYQIKIHKSLLHKNVVHLDHWFQDDTNQYIFMEYCSKGNLQSKMHQLKYFTEQEIKRYGFQVLQGLIYIHQKLVLHRDLKLCNFYLDQNDQVKIGDFGFACQLSHQNQKKRQTCGTPNYIAPQAISGFGYSFTADVWGFGVMLYRMKFQQCPFQGKNVSQTLQNVKLCKYQFPKRKISKQLKNLIEKIFNLNYDQRLTLQQIKQHPFFHQIFSQQNPFLEKTKQQEKKPQRGFSLTRLFSSIGKDKKEEKRNTSIAIDKSKNSKNKQKEKQKSPQNRPKRSNSCETFKQIKQIIKTKTDNSNSNQTNIMNSMRTDAFSQQHITLTSLTQTNRQSKTMRNIIQMSSLNSGISKKDQFSFLNSGASGVRSNKIHQFLKSQQGSMTLKDQMRKSRFQTNVNNLNKNIQNQNCNMKKVESNLKQKVSKQDKKSNYKQQKQSQIGRNNVIKKQQRINTSQVQMKYNRQQKDNQKSNQNLKTVLAHAKSFFILPQKIQIQKDIAIVHFQPDLKLIIYNKISYYLYKNKQQFYNLQGQQQQVNKQKLPKVLKYVLQNNLTLQNWSSNQRNEEDSALENMFSSGIQKLIVKLPKKISFTKQALILHYENQNGQIFIAKMPGQECFYLQTLKNNLMYGQNWNIIDGIVIQRIYQGIVRNFIKKG